MASCAFSLTFTPTSTDAVPTTVRSVPFTNVGLSPISLTLEQFPCWCIQIPKSNVTATGAPSACGRSSRAAYPTSTFEKQKLFGRGVEPPFVLGSRNKRWLDFARHDNLKLGIHLLRELHKRDGVANGLVFNSTTVNFVRRISATKPISLTLSNYTAGRAGCLPGSQPKFWRGGFVVSREHLLSPRYRLMVIRLAVDDWLAAPTCVTVPS